MPDLYDVQIRMDNTVLGSIQVTADGPQHAIEKAASHIKLDTRKAINKKGTDMTDEKEVTAPIVVSEPTAEAVEEPKAE